MITLSLHKYNDESQVSRKIGENKYLLYSGKYADIQNVRCNIFHLQHSAVCLTPGTQTLSKLVTMVLTTMIIAIQAVIVVSRSKRFLLAERGVGNCVTDNKILLLSKQETFYISYTTVTKQRSSHSLIYARFVDTSKTRSPEGDLGHPLSISKIFSFS